MDKITFPIVEVVQNRLVGIDGVKSHFFEITPPDLSQLTNIEIDCFFDDISHFLNNLDDSSFFKFYSIDRKCFLNSNSKEFNLLKVEMGPSNRPLQSFFGSVDIFSDLSIYDDYLLYNGNYRRILSINEFGADATSYDFIPHGTDYVLNIKKKSKDKGLKELEKVRSSHMSSFLKVKRDIESEGAYKQAEDLIHDLTLGVESIFDIELFFIVSGLSLKELNAKTFDLINEMRGRGVTLYIEGQNIKKIKSGLGSIFNELIPGVTPSFSRRSHVDKTSHLKCLLPMDRSFLMDEGIEFFDIFNECIYYNPFSATIQNRNMLVTGSSGGGKSVFVNKVIHSLIKDHPTVILDKGGSFKRLTLYHEGVNLSGKFNPLQFKDPLYLRELILSACDKEQFNKLERGRLLKSIKGIVERDPGLTSFLEFLKHLEDDFTGITLYFEDIIDLFTDELIDDVLVLYVDVDEYPKEAIAPLIIFVLEYFKSIETREKILVFDESWSFLKDHADYIDECFRTFRKAGSLPIAISQGLNDFAGSGGKLYSSITNNSFIKVFFPQEQIDDPEVLEFDQEIIRSLRFEKGKYSECYLKSADNRFRKIIRLYLTPLEMELFHTEAGRDDNFFKFFNEYRPYLSSNKETIHSYVRLKHEEI